MTIKTKTICIILTGLLLSNCGTKKNDELIGHWHYVSTIYNEFKTIDISDSAVTSDIYEIGTAMRVEFKRRINADLEVLPINSSRYSATYFIDHDTLVLKDGQEEYKYIKSDTSKCRIGDRYRNSSVLINNKKSTDGQPFEVSYKEFNSESLFVGKLKDDDKYFDSLMQVYPDSIFIHAKYFNWIKLKDLPKYYSFMTDMWGFDKPYHYVSHDKEDKDKLENGYPGDFKLIYNYNKPMGLIIHADSAVTDRFISKIMDQVPDTISITFFRSVINSSGDIGIKRIIRE